MMMLLWTLRAFFVLSILHVIQAFRTTSCALLHGLIKKQHFQRQSFTSNMMKFRFQHTSLLLHLSTMSSENPNNPAVSNDFNWDRIAKDVFSIDKRPVILFDGICNLCNAGVNFALDHDPDGHFRFVSLQSKIGQSLLLRSGKEANDISSIVLVTEDTAYFKSDAVIRIASKLSGGALIPFVARAGPFVPSIMKNAIYDFVARNRYRFGESDQCRLWDDAFENRFIPDPE